MNSDSTGYILLFRLTKVIFVAVFIFTLGYIFYLNFIPSGTLEVEYSVDQESMYLNNFAKLEEKKKILTDKNNPDTKYWELTEDPVYFDINLPRPTFKNVLVKLLYQNPDQMNPIKIGLKQSSISADYAYQTIGVFNKKILALESNWAKSNNQDFMENSFNTGYDLDQAWHKTREGDLVLWQKNIQYDTIDQFNNNLPQRHEIITYNLDLTDDFKIDQYEPSEKTLEINSGLRDSVKMFTYIKNEDLYFTLEAIDLNRLKGQDNITIQVYKGNEEIYHDEVNDNTEAANKKLLIKKPKELRISNLPEGVYEIVVQGGPDIVFKKIYTEQELVVFGGQLSLYNADRILSKDAVFSAINLTSSQGIMQVKTDHNSGLQTLLVDDSDQVVIDTVHKFSEIELDNNSTITIPINDLIIKTNGVVAFSKNSFFDFVPSKSLDQVNNLDNYSFLIARYPEYKIENGWIEGEVEFNASELWYDQKTLHFIIKATGLDNDKKLNLKDINVSLTKEPITMGNFFARLTDFLKEKISFLQ